MVRFNKESYVIEVHTGINPIESWESTIKDLFQVLQDVNPDMRNEDTYYHLLELLKNMMPDYDLIDKTKAPSS